MGYGLPAAMGAKMALPMKLFVSAAIQFPNESQELGTLHSTGLMSRQ